MITGTGDIGRVASIGFVLFVMWTGVKYMMNPQQGVAWGQALAGFLMYSCMFGPTVTVYVEDVYSGRVTVTNNVPVGPVAAGSIMSQIGYGLTQLQEQGYGLASDSARLTEGGFVDPLKTLVGMRKSEIMNAAFSHIDTKIAGNSKHTLFNYLRDCTMRKPSLQGQDVYDDIMTGQLPDALFLNNDFYTTEVYVGSGPESKNCQSAQVDITRIFDRMEKDDTAEVVTTMIRTEKSNESIGRPNSYRSLEDFFNGFANISANNALNLMSAAIVKPLQEAALQGHLKDGMDTAAATAYGLSIQQRNAQWAAEGTAFIDTMRPFLAYVEGLTFAIAPLASIIVIMGAAGISLVGKYMMLFFWIQLWMPILSITNLYLIQASSDEFNTLAGSIPDFNMGSFYAYTQLSAAAESWVGVGATMMAATPFISLFVVSGSMYTMNALAGKMSSADTFDEGRISPKMGNSPAALSEAPVFQHDQTTGSSHSGSSATIPELSASSIATQGSNSSLASARQSLDKFDSTLSNSLGESWGTGQSHSLTRAATNSDTFTQSEAFQQTRSAVQATAQEMGMSAGEATKATEQVMSEMSAGLSSGKGMSPARVGASLSAAQAEIQETSNTTSASQAERMLSDQGFSESTSVGLQSAFAQSVSEQAQESDSYGLTSGQKSDISQAASYAESESAQYSEVQGFSQSLGQQNSVPLNAAANKVLENPSQAKSVNDAYASAVGANPGLETAAKMAESNLQGVGVNSEASAMGGKIAALTGSGNWEGSNMSQYEDTLSGLNSSGVFGTIFGMSPGATGGVPEAPASGIPASQGSDLGNQSLKDQPINGVSSTAESVESQAKHGLNQDPHAGPTPTDGYNAAHDESTADARGNIADEYSENMQSHLSRAADQPASTSTVPSLASDAGNAVAGIGNYLAQSANFGNWGDARENIGREVLDSLKGDFQSNVDSYKSGFEQYSDSGVVNGLNALQSRLTQEYAGDMGDGYLGNLIEDLPDSDGGRETKQIWDSLSDEDKGIVSSMFNYDVGQQINAADTFEAPQAQLSKIAAGPGNEEFKNLMMAEVLEENGLEGSVAGIPSVSEARGDMQGFMQQATGKEDVSEEMNSINRVATNYASNPASTNVMDVALAMESGETAKDLRSGDVGLFEAVGGGGNTGADSTSAPPRVDLSAGEPSPAEPSAEQPVSNDSPTNARVAGEAAPSVRVGGADPMVMPDSTGDKR